MSEIRRDRLLALSAIIIGLVIILLTMTGVITYQAGEPDGLTFPAALMVAGGVVALHYLRPRYRRNRGRRSAR